MYELHFTIVLVVRLILIENTFFTTNSAVCMYSLIVQLLSQKIELIQILNIEHLLNSSYVKTSYIASLINDIQIRDTLFHSLKPLILLLKSI